MTRLAKYSADLYVKLEAETDVGTGMRQVGSITVALTEERKHEIYRQASLARAFDVDVREISPDEVKEMYPHLNVSDVVGAVHLPLDGQCDPANIAMALAKGARQRGATIVENVKVTKVHTKAGRVTGVSWAQGDEQGTIEADIVVNCAGMWARELGAQNGVTIPLHACEHFYLVTEPIPGLRRPAGAARARRVRLLQGRRRQDDARRLRAGGQALGHGRHPRGFLLRPVARGHGPFRADPRNGRQPHADAGAPPASTPSSTAPKASPPTTATISARRRNCGATGWRPATIRSASSRPAAPAWRWRNGSTTAKPPFDLWEVDIRRAQPFQKNRRYLKERVSETLGLLYADHFPYRQMATSRGMSGARRCMSI